MAKYVATIVMGGEHSLGLHARPSSMLVELANEFSAEISLSQDGNTVDARSLMGVLMLHVVTGSRAELSFEGDDAWGAYCAIRDLFIGQAEDWDFSGSEFELIEDESDPKPDADMV